MTLRQTLRSGVAAVCVAGVIAPAPGVHAQASGIQVKIGQSETFSRIEFSGAAATLRRDGQTVAVRFNRDGDPDIARLRSSPPKWLKTAEKKHVGGRLEIILTLADDADAKLGSADGANYVNVFAKAETAAVVPLQDAPAPSPEPERPNPLPAGGVVRMESKVANGQVQFSFAWANPAGAAVFRRGDVLWVVFDAPANLDVSRAPRGLTQFTGVQAFRGADYAAIRIDAAHDVPVFATSQGSVWTISLGPGNQGQPTAIQASRDDALGPAFLKAAVAGATRVVQVTDPDAGDIVSVVTALGPAKGIASRRDYIQMALLPSIQGMAVESHVEDLTVQRDGDIVKIGTFKGLTLSPAWAVQDKAQADLGAPLPAVMPALVETEAWSKTGPAGFLARYNSLLSAATTESAAVDASKGTDDTPVEARMALARFLVGSELSFEAIGVLNDTARVNPRVLDKPEFRGLRGAARVMARRYKEAQADFSAPVLLDDPSAALWRSYIAGQLAQWTEARSQFAKGAEAFAHFSPVWKARFARTDAQAAIELGDLAGADARIRLALSDKTDPLEECATRLVQARVIELQGHQDRALRMYEALEGAPMEGLSSAATLRATQIKFTAKALKPEQAAATFDELRYRWRGDATELETIRALGQLYLGQGRYREALEVLHSAGNRLPDLPQAMQLQADLSAAFKALFLDGMADGLEPVQALAMFYDFKDLTPIGADGDLMVRKLVRRLVDVDLLDQAADLLKYQVDNRLDGVPKAQVATDLALIYLMDRKPEQAIQTINASRTTVLPTALNAERRIIEARGWAGVGRYESALEIIEKDPSKEAQDLRGEIAWKQKNWAAAGPIFEKALGDRWKNPLPLSAEEEGKLLRAGVAYSLAGDDGALARMNQQYQGFFDQAHNPEALRIALTGVSTGRLSVADFSRTTADNEVFAGWVDKMKTRLKNKPAPLGTGKLPPAAAGKQAQAAPPAGAPAKS